MPLTAKSLAAHNTFMDQKLIEEGCENIERVHAAAERTGFGKYISMTWKPLGSSHWEAAIGKPPLKRWMDIKDDPTSVSASWSGN